MRIGRTLVETAERRAGRRAGIDIFVRVRIVAQEGAPGERLRGRRVVGRAVLNAALILPERALQQVFDAADDMEPPARPAAAGGDAVRIPAAVLGHAAPVIERQAVELLLEREVDDAGDGIRPVDRRSAAAEHFDPVDHADRDVGHVGEVAAALEWQRKVGDAAAVDQHQRVIRTQPAQVHLLRAGGEAGAAERLLALRFAAVLGQRAQDIGHAGIAVGADRIRIDHGDRRRAFDVQPRDARSGDGDLRRGIVRAFTARRRLPKGRPGENGERASQPQQVAEYAASSLFHASPLQCATA